MCQNCWHKYYKLELDATEIVAFKYPSKMTDKGDACLEPGASQKIESQAMSAERLGPA